MKITPKVIMERHKEYPEATEKLIESYAFQEYQKAIHDLERLSDVVNVKNTDTVLIVMTEFDYNNWKALHESHWYINREVTGEVLGKL